MLPLVVREATSTSIARLLRDDAEIVVWWGTWTECATAISRLRREDRLIEETEEQARTRIDRLAESWAEIPPVNEMRLLAALLSKQHPLKTADTLQLAAALRWCEGDTADASFVCLDDRLRRAATDEGFHVLPEPPNEEET